MNNLLINPITRSQLDHYLARPSHALLLTGLPGSGRLAIAKSLAAELLGSVELKSKTNLELVEPDEKNNISIDAVRQLKQFVRLKSESKRVIIIDDADCMLLPAQNSFLKLLEEPPEDVFLILLAPSGILRPTIMSRVQKIAIRLVEVEAAIRYFADYPAETVKLAYQVSGGRVGLVRQLLDRPDDHPLWLAANTARRILKADLFEKLYLIDGLSKDKDAIIPTLEILDRMAHSALEKTPKLEVIRRWQQVQAASYKAQEALAGRANLKLTLTNMMLNL